MLRIYFTIMDNSKELFFFNAQLLIANRERILSNPQLAYASTYIAPLGAVLQWWEKYPRESHDEQGNPLLYMAGNLMSGSGWNHCVVLMPDGEIVDKSVGHWKSGVNTLMAVQKEWQNPPENTFTREDVIVTLTTTGNEWLDRYIGRLRTGLHESHAALLDKDKEIDNMRSFINTLRIERIRAHAYVCLDVLKKDFYQLDILLNAFHRAKNDYYNEKKHNPDSPYLAEMKAAKEDLSTLVRAKEKGMIEQYNCNAGHGLPLTIDELRDTLKYLITATAE